MEDALHNQIFGSKPRKGEKKKVQLTERAIEIIANEAIDALTYDRLGEKLGMTRSHVNYYFSSTLEILEACVRYGIIIGQNLTMKRLNAAKGWKQQLLAIADGAVDWIEAHPDQVRVLWDQCRTP